MVIHLLVVVVMVMMAAGGLRALSRRFGRRHGLKGKALLFQSLYQLCFNSVQCFDERKLVQEWTKIGFEKGTDTNVHEGLDIQE